MRELFAPPRRSPNGMRYAPPQREVRPSDVKCPAGDPLGDGVLCRIEGHLVDARVEPTSVARFCCGRYETCPTFLADWRQREATRKALRDGVEADVG